MIATNRDAEDEHQNLRYNRMQSTTSMWSVLIECSEYMGMHAIRRNNINYEVETCMLSV